MAQLDSVATANETPAQLTSYRALLCDLRWWLALAAAPAFWLLLASSGAALLDLRWPFQHPWQFAKLCLLLPVLEELVFRGIVQGSLLRQAWGQRRPLFATNANVLTSALFAALHLVHHSPLWAAAVVVPSLLFGYFRERYDSVVPAVLLHIFYNTGYFWLFWQPAT